MGQLPNLNIELIAAQAKARWLKDARASLTIQDRMAMSVPFWIVLIGLSALLLSAGHTMQQVSALSSEFQIGPVVINLGVFAPLMIEFGLLWAAFSRVFNNGKISLALRILELVFIAFAVIVNLFGSFDAVARNANLSKLSVNDIMSQFWSLPANVQASLIIVPLFSCAIPVVTWVAGEAVASLFLDRSRITLEGRYRDVETQVLYRALFNMLSAEMSASDARKMASALSVSYVSGKGRTPDKPRTDDAVPALPEPVQVPAASVRPPRTDRTDIRRTVFDHLDAHPDDAGLSVRELAEKLGKGKTSVGEAVKEWRAGHGN